MPDITPGCEDEFRRLSSWLAASHRIDRIIEDSEGTAPVTRRNRLRVAPVARPEFVAAPARGLRAGVAARLARFALAVHPRAAAEAVLRPGSYR